MQLVKINGPEAVKSIIPNKNDIDSQKINENNFHILKIIQKMKLNFTSNKIVHIVAFGATVVLHAVIAISSLLPSKPVVLNKQAIHVSFVAPSAQNKVKQNAEIQDKKAPIKAEKLEKKQLANNETSGRVDEKSKEITALESEPLFDAAYLNNPAPKYPASAKRRNIEGKVLLEVSVNADGEAAKVRISRSSGFPILDNAALEAVKNWRFIPAKKSGKAVAAQVIVPIEFKIV